jgi:hypothetical protein
MSGKSGPTVNHCDRTNATLFGVWSLVGNNGIDASNQFLGTTDPRPLKLRANNKQVMRFTEGTTRATHCGR